MSRRRRKQKEEEAKRKAEEEAKIQFTPNPPELDGVPDLSMLLYLEEDNVLHNLRCRYKHKKKDPYTSISTVLVAINPYERLPIYGPDKINQFCESQGEGNQNDPHVFAVGARAYRLMIQKKKNQSIIVCGESGAGKSESAKYMMRFLAYTAEQAKATQTGEDFGDSMVEQQVLAATPILESFGNAKTILNNNSSRFGKFTKLLFSNWGKDVGRILGSSLDTYLLEKSRVVHQDKNERNFHVFYQITKGADAAFQREYKVDGFKKFHYMNQGGDPNDDVPHMSDNGRFQELKDAFSLMRIDKVQQSSVFGLVAGILNLGNINFAENEKSYSSITPQSDEFVNSAAGLFGIKPEDLHTRLTSRTIKVNLQTITSPLTMHEAPLNRDAMSKSLFSGIFQWLCRRINAELLVDEGGEDDEKENEMLFIGILDVFGFESFVINSFEQFCINFANERLQGFFNENIIASEQEEYIREGIFWKPLKVPDNSEMLVLVDDRRKGIFSLLDAACQMPKGTPRIFTDNLFQANKKSKKVVAARAPCRPKPGQKWSEVKGSKGFNGFALNHYAGEVIYDASKFLAKNADFIHPDTAALFQTSADRNVCEILHDPGDGKSKKKRRKAFQSVGGNFSKGLTELMTTLRQTAPFFVRCVNPNNKQSSKIFQDDYVRKQLRCGGLIEALRVIKLGYPTRIPYIAIYKQYSNVLDHPLITNFGERDFCEAILVAFGLKEEHYEMGLTKVFFKPNRASVLDEILDWGSRPLTTEHLKRITTWIVSKRWKKLRGSLKAFMYLSWSLGSVKARRDFYRITGIVHVYCQTFRKTLNKIREKIRVRNERSSVLTFQKLFRTHILQSRWEKERAAKEKRIVAEFQEQERERMEMERLERERQEKLRIAKEKAETEERERLMEIRNQREKREQEETERQERERIRLEEERKERERLMKIENERQRRLREEEERRREEQRSKEKNERERRIKEEEERLKREAKEAELRRIQAIKDEDERQKAIIEAKRRERDDQRKKILYMQRKMEEELASEMAKLEQLEMEEDDERRKREEKLQHEAEEKRRAEEEQNRPIMLQAGPRAAAEAEPVSQEFLQLARTGQLFLKHSKGTVRKRSKPQERFVKIACLDGGTPKNISWGSGDRMIEFSDVLYVVTGHVTTVFRNSSVDPTLCFSVVTPRRTLDLQAPDAETAYVWVKGLRSIMGHTAEYSEEAAKNNVERKVKKQREREKKTKVKPVKERTNSMVLLQQDLFVMTVTTVFRHIEEEGMWIVPRDLAAKYPATDLYKQAVREKIPWRDWNEWIKRHIIEILEPTPKAIAHATGGGGAGDEKANGDSPIVPNRDSLSLSYPESSAADTEPSRSSRKSKSRRKEGRSDSTGSDVQVDYNDEEQANGDRVKPRKSKKKKGKYGTLKKIKNAASRRKLPTGTDAERGDCKQQ